jgi:hypothetical protein
MLALNKAFSNPFSLLQLPFLRAFNLTLKKLAYENDSPSETSPAMRLLIVENSKCMEKDISITLEETLRNQAA